MGPAAQDGRNADSSNGSGFRPFRLAVPRRAAAVKPASRVKQVPDPRVRANHSFRMSAILRARATASLQ
ncbi:hypothetical protein C7S13_2613 [Burkholderia cepacia]|nr:hypothetical protein [Burkholderia cepacia]